MQKLFHLDEDAAKHEADTNESMNALREGPRLDWAKDVDHQAVICCVKQTETHPKDGHKGKQNWERTGLFAKVETNNTIPDGGVAPCHVLRFFSNKKRFKATEENVKVF